MGMPSVHDERRTIEAVVEELHVGTDLSPSGIRRLRSAIMPSPRQSHGSLQSGGRDMRNDLLGLCSALTGTLPCASGPAFASDFSGLVAPRAPAACLRPRGCLGGLLLHRR
jgi:hypothetical protein